MVHGAEDAGSHRPRASHHVHFHTTVKRLQHLTFFKANGLTYSPDFQLGYHVSPAEPGGGGAVGPRNHNKNVNTHTKKKEKETCPAPEPLEEEAGGGLSSRAFCVFSDSSLKLDAGGLAGAGETAQNKRRLASRQSVGDTHGAPGERAPRAAGQPLPHASLT